jgi:protoporphyrinogen oxidase
MKHFVFVGGGLPSMMMAYWLKSKNPNFSVSIIEKSGGLGGQYGSFRYRNGIVFDHGMHLYYETGNPEIDSIITDVLPADLWNIHSGNEKDIAGIYFNGKLQQDTPYPDLRRRSDRTALLEDLFSRKRCHYDERAPDSAMDMNEFRFGARISEDVFRGIYEKLFCARYEDLDPRAGGFLALNRVALMDIPEWNGFRDDPWFRERVAYPDQLNLPALRTTDQKAFYPKKYGMFFFIERFRGKLAEKGVECLLEEEIQAIDPVVGDILLKSGKRFKGVERIFWGAGLFGLPSYLDQARNPGISRFRKKPVTRYVNMIFEDRPSVGRLYYFYCFDRGFRTFRVTDYSNYCPGAVSASGGFPVSVEIHPEVSDGDPDDTTVMNVALSELKKMNVLTESSMPLFWAVERSAGGFFVPTRENFRVIEDLQSIGSGFPRMDLIGLMSNNQAFFLKDVLLDAFEKVRKYGY